MGDQTDRIVALEVRADESDRRHSSSETRIQDFHRVVSELGGDMKALSSSVLHLTEELKTQSERQWSFISSDETVVAPAVKVEDQKSAMWKVVRNTLIGLVTTVVFGAILWAIVQAYNAGNI